MTLHQDLAGTAQGQWVYVHTNGDQQRFARLQELLSHYGMKVEDAFSGDPLKVLRACLCGPPRPWV